MEMFGNWAAYLFVGSIVLPMGLGIFLIIHAQRSKRKALASNKRYHHRIHNNDNGG